MINLKTFATPIKISLTTRELEDVDEQVEAFLTAEGVDTAYAMSDSATVGKPVRPSQPLA